MTQDTSATDRLQSLIDTQTRMLNTLQNQLVQPVQKQNDTLLRNNVEKQNRKRRAANNVLVFGNIKSGTPVKTPFNLFGNF